MTYSFEKESPGYTAHVVTQANKFLAGFNADFSALFVENPLTEKERAARGYFLKLDTNEQAALREVSTSMKSRGCF